MLALSTTTNLAHVIQLAIAPVFLLTGVGAILSVLVNRLGRVIDRFRALEFPPATASAHANLVASTERAILERRARFIHWAIGLCTCCALLVCFVIVTLFIGSITGIELSAIVALLFIAAMLVLVTGLLCFLREIALATGGMHIQLSALPHSRP